MTEVSTEQWSKEAYSNRVSVSRNENNLRINIRAEEFNLGNNFLTLCLSIGIIGEAALVYLMFASGQSLAVLGGGFVFLAIVMTSVFTRVWLWHHFGEEVIELKNQSLYVKRNYAIYSSKIRMIELNEYVELFSNRMDNWNWLEFRQKGIFRVSNENESVDFGIKVSDQEYEMIISPISKRLNKIRLAFQLNPELGKEIDQTKEDIPAEDSPPSIEVQQEGKHKEALDKYFQKSEGASSETQEDNELKDKNTSSESN